MSDPRLDTLQLNDIRLRVASLGEGPLVLFCHGRPAPATGYKRERATEVNALLLDFLQGL